MDTSWQPVTGAAQRRRGRRLRAAWRHEQQSIAQALAAYTHHTQLAPRRQTMARAGVWVRGALHGEGPEAPTPQEPGTRYYCLDDNDSVPELGGSRLDRLSGVRPQERVPRRIVEQIVDSAPVLPLLHDPEPQLVDSVEEVRKILDNLLPDVEQVISAQDSSSHGPAALLSLGAADGRTVGGSARDRADHRGTRPRRRWCCLVPHCGAHVAHARARHWLGATASPGRNINTGQR